MRKSRTAKTKRSQSCKDKESYIQLEAELVLYHQKHAFGSTAEIYLCRFCHSYHIGHDNRKKWK